LRKRDSSLEGWKPFKVVRNKDAKPKSFVRLMLKGVSNPNGSQQLPVEEINMTIPTDLVTMVRRTGSISQHEIVFMTRRIAEIIADVQREGNW
jgi:hypothetical protein